MGWNRRAPEAVQAPTPPSLWRWLFVLVMAVLTGGFLFLMYAWQPLLQVFNVWALCCSPLLACLLVFAARAYFYGGALSHFEFLQAQALDAQSSWQNWAQRYMAVLASSVLLPDRVSAAVLMSGAEALPPRTGVARRIDTLPHHAEDRAPAGIGLLLPGLTPALEALHGDQPLNVTLLTDIPADEYTALTDAWAQAWSRLTGPLPLARITVVADLSYQWVEDKLKTASSALELIVVLQVRGGTQYSDGLATLLLCPDAVARARKLPVARALLRPMPLTLDSLEQDVSMLLQTQPAARGATGLLADAADWEVSANKLMALAGAQGAALSPQQRWTQESLCGLPGPFSHWQVAALGAEMAPLREQSLMVLAQEQSRHWIGILTAGALA